MNILDDVEAYTRLKNSIDTHYTKVNGDELVKKAEVVRHIEQVKAETSAEAQRLIREHHEQTRHTTTESSRKMVEDHRVEATKKADETSAEFRAAIASSSAALEQHRKGMEDYKKAVERTFDEHRKAIEDKQRQLTEDRKAVDDYKRITDERIEKLVKLFLSLHK